MRRLRWIPLIAVSAFCGIASGQSPGVLYTWNGTGNTHDWAATSSTNSATLTNNIAGQLTVTEMGDEIDPNIMGGAIVIRDGFNRRLESSTSTGGLDLTGLEFIEIDVAHNGTGNVSAQFFTQVTPDFLYTWAGSNGVRNGPDFTLAPGMNTLQYPIGLLTPAEQAYIRTIGLSVRDHAAEGNLTWTVSELRSVGTPLTLRDLATHDVGTSDNGLNGAIANFDVGAIQGNDGGQNQTGLSHNTAGSGSLRWTDLGDHGVEDPSGAAITWYNGTAWLGNSFNERLSDFSNYNRLTVRMSATDALMGGGDLGVQGFFQTGNFDFQVASDELLPIDGQFHDVVFSLGGVTNRTNTQSFGINLFAHPNDLVIDVDLVRFEMVEGVLGDYNENGIVDAADYTLWRDNLGSAIALPNEGASPNMVDQEDYDFWKLHFGEVAPGSGGASASAVPEPATLSLGMIGLALGLTLRRRNPC